MVERFFSELTNKRVRRVVTRSVKELEMAVMDFVNKHNDNPKVFTLTKDANTILSKVNIC